MGWDRKGLHEISDLSKADITALLDAAAAWRSRTSRMDGSLAPARDHLPLEHRTVITLFFENSTRTRVSFERAAHLLGATVINFDVAHSSVNKGESLADTVATLDAMRPDAIVVRHSENGSSRVVAKHTRAPVINAGDGTHAHPTQALLDALTLRDHFGKVDGLRIVIVGDVVHSRVAKSTATCLRTLGARVALCGPPSMAPVDTLKPLGFECGNDLDAALRGADVAYMLRIQYERHSSTPAAAGSSSQPHNVGAGAKRDYINGFQLDNRRLRLLNSNGVVMHPGPVNRGIELTDDVMDGPRSLILQQVASGVFARMAVMEAVSGSRG